ncbi:MAG: hypothetical protein CM15mP83_9310 [Flavobacteriaceae bacterium]|nr:MAG: hypothetical protein CM15mP83_9310 [Flavobacteriaceae bacterium]
MLQVGMKAPDFSVQDHDGNTVSLSDYAGKKVVIFFYPKANTLAVLSKHVICEIIIRFDKGWLFHPRCEC